MSKQPTSEEVIAFWNYMAKTFGSTTKDRNSSGLMKTIGWFLDAIGIMDKEDFLSNYTTTIDHTIYTPFVVGEATPGYDLWEQIEIGTHENQHVWQASEMGIAKFGWRYVTSNAHRAQFEAEAYRCGMELHFWHHGSIPSTQSIANNLKAYGCGPEDVEYVKNYLDSSAETVLEGGVISKASQVAIEWLSTHAPHLKA